MKKASKKDQRRLFVLTLLFIPLLIFFISNMFSFWSTIYKNIKTKKELELVYTSKLEEEESLKSEITKLKDPEYVAKYAREKYLYSKNGELIIKIPEEWQELYRRLPSKIYTIDIDLREGLMIKLHYEK